MDTRTYCNICSTIVPWTALWFQQQMRYTLTFLSLLAVHSLVYIIYHILQNICWKKHWLSCYFPWIYPYALQYIETTVEWLIKFKTVKSLHTFRQHISWIKLWNFEDEQVTKLYGLVDLREGYFLGSVSTWPAKSFKIFILKTKVLLNIKWNNFASFHFMLYCLVSIFLITEWFHSPALCCQGRPPAVY